MKVRFTCYFLLVFHSFLFANASGNAQLDSLQQQLPLAKTLKDSLDISIKIGDVYFSKDDYKNALKYYFSTLNQGEISNDHKAIGAAYNRIGNCYYHMSDYHNALNYYHNSLAHYKAINDIPSQGGALNNLALVYFDSDSLDQALTFFKKALDFKKDENKKDDMGAIYHNLGLVYNEKKDYNKAREYLKRALDIFNETGNVKYQANTLNSIGRTYEKNKQYEEALAYYDQALKKAKSSRAFYIMMDNYSFQNGCYANLGNYKNAYLYNQFYHNLKDSLNNIEKGKQIAEIQAKYENEIRDRQNRLLTKQNETNQALIQKQYAIGIAIGITSILLAILAVFLWYSFRQKQKANKLLKTQKQQIEEKNRTLADLNKEISNQKHDLEELNQIKDKLFSIISHEFRSPLNSLKGTLALLMAGILSDDELKTLSRDLTDKINNTSIFLDNLLNWAKSQMNGIEAKPAEVDLQMLVNDNIKLLVTQADKKEIALVNKIGEPLVAFTDPNMMNLVLKNLISNAIKFSLRGGAVEIEAKENDHKITVSISDHGIGMPEENIKKLFELETFTTRGTANEKGTGLGLFISKNFIETNGGKIWINSKEGLGSTFSFTVPLARQRTASL